MTIDALLRLVELLTDTADYAAAVNQPTIAAELAMAAGAAQLLLDDERVAARRVRRTPVAA